METEKVNGSSFFREHSGHGAWRPIPFPDGAIIAAIHWTRVTSEDNKVLDSPFPGTQSFVIGSLVNLQFMVKNSKKYAATGGWGFADF